MKEFKIKNSITRRDDESLKRYFVEISRYPALTAEEEKQLAVRIKAGDEAARNKLICCNLKFNVSVAKSYVGYQLSLTDLIAEGHKGLIKAADKFDSSREFKFISYAVWWIRHHMTAGITDQRHLIRLPGNQVAAIIAIYNAEGEMEQLLGRKPTQVELSEYTGLTEEKIRQAYLSDLCVDSLDDTDGEDFSPLETIADSMFPAPDNILEQQDAFRQIRSALKSLPGYQGKILYLFFDLGRSGPMSVDGIASHLDISIQTVQQNKTKGLTTLKSRPDLEHLHRYLTN
jgi:RNA polymerase primary sigma factor